MIGRLRGLLVGIRSEGAVLEVAGIGYEVAVTPRNLAELPGVGEEVVLHTHLHVREDALVLFGFASEPERDLFRVLLSASGVGPKVAMAVLAAMDPAQIRHALATEDVDALTVVPGIGKRSAQKMILELRPKVALLEADVIEGSGGGTRQLREALEGLGYGSGEIRDVLAELPDGSVEERLRAALRALGQR